MENENKILSKIPPEVPAGPYLLGYAQAVSDLNKDWDTFRREAAKDILIGMVSNPKTLEYGITRDLKVSTALKYADELIKQLKETKK